MRASFKFKVKFSSSSWNEVPFRAIKISSLKTMRAKKVLLFGIWAIVSCDILDDAYYFCWIIIQLKLPKLSLKERSPQWKWLRHEKMFQIGSRLALHIGGRELWSILTWCPLWRIFHPLWWVSNRASAFHWHPRAPDGTRPDGGSLNARWHWKWNQPW